MALEVPRETPMSDHDATTAHHADARDGGHDEHGHDAGALGRIDWRMWLVGVVGVVAALIVVAGFVAATNFAFTA
jgi:ABC-type Zn2+ transport system substrate-binding protein/surface adhesin